MYPKVKVRQDEPEEVEDPTQYQKIYLKNYPSNSNSNSNSNSLEHEDGYTPPHVRVPMSHTSSVTDSKISAKASKLNKKGAEIDTKPSSVLPPRAVLSSPENDAMVGVGTKHKTKTDRSSLKNHSLRQNTHNKCKKSYEVEKKRHTGSWK
ncbi:uncharacterized protein [Rutidosis leptorrhynchoides]|uniref:uncharacterized protein n=1 Tax=Rutidosis leptorrhynchoides TaxID=125765 RepID=UPI003A9A17D0